MPKLVLLPGMDGTSELFVPFVAALPKDFEPICIRYPSDRFLSYAQLEILVRSACPVSEPFFLIAESFSCPLAIQFAATRCDKTGNAQGAGPMLRLLHKPHSTFALDHFAICAARISNSHTQIRNTALAHRPGFAIFVGLNGTNRNFFRYSECVVQATPRRNGL